LLSARGRSEAGESFESAQVPLTLDEDSEPPFARLVARRSLVLKGQILSSEGPVPGAHIKPVAVQAPLAAVPILRADGDGRFEFRLPPATSEIGLSVGALGYAVRILRMPVAVDRPATVLLERLGGKLVLEIPEIPKGGPGVVVAHGGFYESVSYLSGWAAANGGGQNEMGQMVIPQLEPGRYAACISTVPDLPGLSKGVLPQEGCAQGTLSAGGELILKVPAPLAPSGSPR
jgi:hypothetical protein